MSLGLGLGLSGCNALSASAPFTPATPSGLVLWYDSEHLTVSGGTVVGATDLGPSGNHSVDGTGGTWVPTRTASSAKYNGLPCITNGASGQAFQTSVSLALGA